MQMSLYSGKPIVKYQPYDQEILFTYERKEYPTEPIGNVKEAVEKVLQGMANRTRIVHLVCVIKDEKES